MSVPKLYTVCTNEELAELLGQGCASVSALVDTAVGYKPGDRIIFVGPDQEFIDTRFFTIDEIKSLSEMGEAWQEEWEPVGDDYQPAPKLPGTANDNEPVVIVCSFHTSPLKSVDKEDHRP